MHKRVLISMVDVAKTSARVRALPRFTGTLSEIACIHSHAEGGRFHFGPVPPKRR